MRESLHASKAIQAEMNEELEKMKNNMEDHTRDIEDLSQQTLDENAQVIDQLRQDLDLAEQRRVRERNNLEASIKKNQTTMEKFMKEQGKQNDILIREAQAQQQEVKRVSEFSAHMLEEVDIAKKQSLEALDEAHHVTEEVGNQRQSVSRSEKGLAAATKASQVFLESINPELRSLKSADGAGRKGAGMTEEEKKAMMDAWRTCYELNDIQMAMDMACEDDREQSLKLLHDAFEEEKMNDELEQKQEEELRQKKLDEEESNAINQTATVRRKTERINDRKSTFIGSAPSSAGISTGSSGRPTGRGVTIKEENRGTVVKPSTPDKPRGTNVSVSPNASPNRKTTVMKGQADPNNPLSGLSVQVDKGLTRLEQERQVQEQIYAAAADLAPAPISEETLNTIEKTKQKTKRIIAILENVLQFLMRGRVKYDGAKVARIEITESLINRR